MSGFSNYLANQIINDTLVTPYATRYLALFINNPTDANVTTNEVSAAWYSRKGTGAWASPTTGVTSNLSVIQFDPVTGAQVTITHWGIYDAATSGNLLYSGAWTTPKTFNVDDFPVIAAGDLDLELL
jgi:hypothetical protein